MAETEKEIEKQKKGTAKTLVHASALAETGGERGGEKRIKVAEARRILPTHGRTFTGTVVSDKMSRTVTVSWERRQYVPKYQRYERRYSKVKAHNPDTIDAKLGDIVTVMETRPISKTKSFIVIKKRTETVEPTA